MRPSFSIFPFSPGREDNGGNVGTWELIQQTTAAPVPNHLTASTHSLLMHQRTAWAPNHQHSGHPHSQTVHHNLTLCLSSSFQKQWHSWNSLPHNEPCSHFLLLDIRMPIFSWTELISSIWAPRSTRVRVIFTHYHSPSIYIWELSRVLLQATESIKWDRAVLQLES